jgi:cobalt-zinc-cadmium efflux system outer membrane protein
MPGCGRERVAGDLAHSRQALIEMRATLSSERARLAGILGLPPDALTSADLTFDLYDQLPQPASAELEQFSDQALLARRDIERAIADYDARELELRRRVGAQRFQLALGPGYSYDHGVRKATFGVSFVLPVFNREQGPIAEAYAAREEAGRQAEGAQMAALNEIATARTAYAQALVSLASTRQQLESATALHADAQRRLDAGDLDRPAVLSAQAVMLTERMAEVDGLDRAQQALGALEDALRRPLTGPEIALDGVRQ